MTEQQRIRRIQHSCPIGRFQFTVISYMSWLYHFYFLNIITELFSEGSKLSRRRLEDWNAAFLALLTVTVETNQPARQLTQQQTTHEPLVVGYQTTPYEDPLSRTSLCMG